MVTSPDMGRRVARVNIDGGALAALNRRFTVADVAQLVERRFVVPVVAGSIPVVRPIFLLP